MKFRFRYQVAGGHTHVRVFAGEGDTLGKCGDLCFRNEEWQIFLQTLEHGNAAGHNVQILEEGQYTERESSKRIP